MYTSIPGPSHSKYSSSYNRSNINNNNNYQQQFQQQNHQDLVKYLQEPSNNTHDKYSNKLKKQIISAQIQSINTQIINLLTKQKFGDLTIWVSNQNNINMNQTEQQWLEIQKTITLVKTLINIINRQSQQRKDLTYKLRRSDEIQNQLNNTIQKINKDKKSLEKQKENLQLKIKSIERQFKQDIQKLKKQKQQSQRKFNQIQSRQNHYKNQFRKNEQTIAQLQQKIKNKTTDKVNAKNTFQKIQNVQKYGPTIILSNSQNQFNQFFVNNFQTTYRQIIDENEYFKKCLQSIYQELHSLLQVKKQIIKKRKGYDEALQSQAFQLNNLKVEAFNLPKQFSKDAISKLSQNLFKFKQAIKIHQLVNDNVKDQKVKCVNNVKSLINNYKDIVQNQDKLINRIVLKSKQYKSNQMQSIESKFSKNLQEDDIQRSKKFLQEQRQILINRNKQLQMTRKAMKNTIKKAEQQKRLFQKKKAQTNQQLLMLKKNIQNIPAIVEQQLANLN